MIVLGLIRFEGVPRFPECSKTYPTNKHRSDELQIPKADCDLIIEALAKDGDKVLVVVKAYRAATDTWPANERKFIHKLSGFLSDPEYLKDHAEWQQRSGPPVNPADIIRKQRGEMGFFHTRNRPDRQERKGALL